MSVEERRAPRRSVALAALAERFEVQNRPSDTSTDRGIRPPPVQRVRTFNFQVLVALERAKDNPADIVALSTAIKQSKDAGVPTSKTRPCEEILVQEVGQKLQTALVRRDVRELELMTSLGIDCLDSLPELVQARQLLIELNGSQSSTSVEYLMGSPTASSRATSEGSSACYETPLLCRRVGAFSEEQSPEKLPHNLQICLESPQPSLHRNVTTSTCPHTAVTSDSRSYVPRKVKTYEYRDILALEDAKQCARDIKSLRRAVHRAKEAGLPSAKIKACEDLLTRAEEDKLALKMVTESGDMTALASALRSSSSVLRGESEFSDAQRVLAELATKELETAVAAKEVAALHAVIEKSSSILANQPILANAQRVLTNLRATEATNEIQSAVNAKDIAMLARAIENSSFLVNTGDELRSASLDVLRVAALDAEKLLSRLRIECSTCELARATNCQDITELELAIAAHRGILATELESACLEYGDISELEVLSNAQAALAKLKIAQCVAEVTRGIRNESLTRSIVASLRTNIQIGETLEIDSKIISSATDILVEAESFDFKHWCAVCLDEEKDAFPLPCCGRADSSNLVCDDCVATLARRAQRCPFCRKSRVKRRPL